jgi:hypothetical protein
MAQPPASLIPRRRAEELGPDDVAFVEAIAPHEPVERSGGVGAGVLVRGSVRMSLLELARSTLGDVRHQFGVSDRGFDRLGNTGTVLVTVSFCDIVHVVLLRVLCGAVVSDAVCGIPDAVVGSDARYNREKCRRAKSHLFD